MCGYGKYYFSFCVWVLILFNFRDSKEVDWWYETIAVVEFSGEITSFDHSSGHYKADVKDRKTNNWYKTNDNMLPQLIEESDVSEQGCVVLLKRK